ncbi:50S ribosomal protein L28 [Patescibacteria group bacterium]|nr:50S ribosomal protein L28 [Patescibacteria group bacterium]
MSRRCQITGKKSLKGYNVSHSKRHTKKTFLPNVQKKSLLNPATGRMMIVKLSTRALRTLQKWQEEGKKYDLRTLIKK